MLPDLASMPESTSPFRCDSRTVDEMPSNASAEHAISELGAPEATYRSLIAIVALGVAFDLAFNGQRPGLSIPLFATLLAVSFRRVSVRSVETDVLLAGAVVVAVFPALRASPPLVALDVLAASALFGLAATQDLGPVGRTSLTGLVRRGIAILLRALLVPRFLAAPLAQPVERRRSKTALRAALIAFPILALFASLLASGDRVFARMLSSILPEWNLGSLLSHIVLTIVGVVLIAILWRSARGAGREAEPKPEGTRVPVLGFAEWATVLAGIDLLFAAFVIVQFAYLFGGNARVVVTPGLTYAEYARSGFFQLAAAAALTVLVILATWDAGRRDDARHERWFRGLVAAMVGLTAVVLVSAVKRLALYEGTFGFTINRFFGYVVIISIGAVLLVVLAAILANTRERVVAGFLLVGFAALLVVNIVNPERFVAERNVVRFETVGKIDLSYLGRDLGDDAIPVLTSLLDRLSREDAATVRAALCGHLDGLEPEPSWRSANLGRASARSALAAAGITTQTCEKLPFPARR